MGENSRRVAIIEVSEPWATAKLEDGTIVKCKSVFLGAHIILQGDNKTPVYNADGSPMYKMNMQHLLVIEAYESVPNDISRN